MTSLSLAQEICVKPYQMQQPFQLTEKSFRRYEDVIKDSVNNFPNPTAFNPAPLSPNTFAARLRDALRSLELYRWKTSIDEQKLTTIRPHFVIKINKAGNIVVCSKTSDLETVGTLVETKKHSPKARLVTNVTDSELMAFILLLSNQRIDPIKITGQNTATINLACKGFDVEFIEEEDGVVLL